MARSALSPAQILEVAADLISRQGYAATSIADIAGAVGTSKAGIYYHFNSKAEILDALSRDHVRLLDQLAHWANTEAANAEEILLAYVDGCIRTGPLMLALVQDPSAREGLDLHGFNEHCERIVKALADHPASAIGRVRARAALAVAQNAATIITTVPVRQRKQARAELLAAAIGALSGSSPSPLPLAAR